MSLPPGQSFWTRLAALRCGWLALCLSGFAVGAHAQTVFPWPSGAIPTQTIGALDTLDITTSADHSFNGQSVLNNGLITWQGGYLRSGFNAVLTNSSTGIVNDSASSHLDNPFGGGYGFTFQNDGTYNKTATGTTNIDTTFNNTGTVNVQAGEFRINSNGANSGTGVFNTSSGAITTFSGSYALASGSQLLGSGTYQLVSGNLDLAGSITASNLSLLGGTISGSQTLHGNGYLWTASDLNSATGTLTTIASDGTLTIATANDHNLNQRSVTNNGVVNWQGGYLRSGFNATFTNTATGIVNDSASSHLDNPFGGGYGFTFQNDGTYNKTATGTTNIDTTFNNTGTVNVQAGEFRINSNGANSGTGVFNTSSGAITTFSGSYALASGSQLLGSGTYQLVSGNLDLAGSITASNLSFLGGTISGSQTLHGSGYYWSASNLSSGIGTLTTIASDGTFTIATSNDHNLNQRSVTNNGVVNWQGGYLRSGFNATFTNTATGIVNDSASSHLDNPFGGGYGFTFLNQGTYNKTATGTTNIDTTFNNTGTINVQAGEFQINSDGGNSGTGIFNTSSGATTTFSGSYALASGSQLLGSGTYQLITGNLDLAGSITASNLGFLGGTISGSQTLHGNGYYWSASNLSSGTGTLTTIATDGTVTIATLGDHNFNQRSVTNNGVVNWQGGYLRSGFNATFTNSSTGTFNDSASSHVDNPFGGGYGFTFQNQGTYNKTASGTTNIDTTFNNTGTVNVQAGEFRINSNGASSGSFSTAAGAITTFNGSYVLADGSQLLGLGAYQIVAGGLTINGNLYADSFAFLGGALGGSQTLHGPQFNWQATDWNAGTSVTTTIATDGVLSITTGGDHTFNQRNVVNHGLVQWQGGYLRSGYNATFTNASDGTFTDTASSHIDNPFGGGYGFTFLNQGTYLKAGAGTTNVDTPFTNSGLLVITAGTLAFNSTFTNSGGSLFVYNGSQLATGNTVDLTGGTLGGSGTIAAPLVLADGLVSPGASPGQLLVTGDLTLLGTAQSFFEIGGTAQGTSYDFLGVGGVATLGGTLNVTMYGGFESTIQGTDTFTILTATSLIGAYSNAANGSMLLTTDGFGYFQVNYSGTAVTLSNFTAVPEPGTWTLLGLGSLVLAVGRWRRQRRSTTPSA